ncbi:MAG: alpha-L-fucosidase [Bacteroidetes bacterium]|nr:alpha-L-fucosidase [Bacteroidota bacterium]
MSKIVSFTLGCLLLIPFLGVSQTSSNYTTIDSTDTPQEIIRKAAQVVPSERQLRWQKLELTAFFHFGINTFTNKEWGEGNENPEIFNPTNFDAEQWIISVKNGGFKQVILTAKHHDGFCLWPTKTTTHSVAISPWRSGKGDVVKEVADACHKHGIGFGVYLSPWDRNASCYGTDAYNDFFVNQLTELLTQYGQVDEVWFDGACGEGPNGKKQVYDFMRWYALIRKLQPQAVIAIMAPDIRWVGTETGMGRETEWSVIPTSNLDLSAIASQSQNNVIFKPKTDLMGNILGSREQLYAANGLVWYPAETDVSIRPGWFYHPEEDSKVKTAEELMNIYLTSVGMNSVLLLNIPPNKEGLIAPEDVQSLQAFAQLKNKIFSEKFPDKSTVVSCENGVNIRAIADQKYETYFTTNKGDTTTIIEFDSKGPRQFNLLMIQENIMVGQRIEHFVLEYFDSQKGWMPCAEGTTVGYKRIIKFPEVSASGFRLKILSSRLEPTISEFGLYYWK